MPKKPNEMSSPFVFGERTEQDWNRVVGDGNYCIRNCVQPKNSGVPEITMTMGHEIAGEQLSEEFKHDDLHERAHSPASR